MKQHRKLRRYALLLAICLLVGGLSGCALNKEDTAQTGDTRSSGSSSGSAQPSAESEQTGSGQREKQLVLSLPGAWTLVLIESDGMQMTAAAFEDAADCTVNITLEEGGAGELTYTYSAASAYTEKLLWARDGDTLTLTPQDAGSDTLTAQLGNNCFTMESDGMTMTFAKEGTDAVDPTRYLDESVTAFMGTWTPRSVRIDGGESQTSLDGAEVSGLIRLTLNADLSAEASVHFAEKNVDTTCYWALKDGKAILTTDELDFSLALTETGSLLIAYTAEDGAAYEFTCSKAED